MTVPAHSGPAPYFHRRGSSEFAPSSSVQGAWNTKEQHVAPALGLLAHVLDCDHRSRHEVPLELARVTFDILGTLDIDEVETSARVVRAGRTIELTEAALSQNGRIAVSARAWFLGASETSSVVGTTFAPMPARETLERWNASEIWPGEFVTTIEVRRRQESPGRAWFWMRPRASLLGEEEVSDVSRLLGLVDIANGITPRRSPAFMAFPNVDLTAHLFRAPASEWIGFDTSVSYGPRGHGLTHTILHDETGPIGTVAQSLTLRP